MARATNYVIMKGDKISSEALHNLAKLDLACKCRAGNEPRERERVWLEHRLTCSVIVASFKRIVVLNGARVLMARSNGLDGSEVCRSISLSSRIVAKA